MRILIVEDDASVASFVEGALSDAGYKTNVVGDGRVALIEAGRQRFDLMVLDVMLPVLNGIEVCKRLRGAANHIPILIITAKDRLEDKIEGLDSGADDYLVKPFQIGELLARVRALLRRSNATHTDLSVGDLRLDTDTRRAVRGTRTIVLSSTEYTLLELLMMNAGKVLTRDSIMQHVWQYHFDGNDSVLDVYISYLRGKIDKGEAASLIRTVRGTGYMIEAPDVS
jgi:DNA-binding response OmpR family regulator